MTNSVSPFTLDKYGTRAKRVKNIYAPDNIYAKKITAILAVIIFCGIDLLCLSTVFNLVQTENPVYAWSVALGVAIALDVPMAIGAIALKKYHHGVMNKNEAMITLVLSVIVFAIAFGFSFAFRLVTRDLTFDIGTSSAMVNMAAGAAAESTGTSSEDTAILVAAIFNGVVPLLTSIASFVVSYFSTSPVNDKLRTLEAELVALNANIADADKAIAETRGGASEFCRGLVAREHDLFPAFFSHIGSHNQMFKQLTRVIVMEKLGRPDDISAVTDSARRLYDETPHDYRPGNNYLQYIEEKLSKGDASDTENNGVGGTPDIYQGGVVDEVKKMLNITDNKDAA